MLSRIARRPPEKSRTVAIEHNGDAKFHLISFFCLLLSAFCLCRRHRHVIPVDHFVVRAMPQCPGDLFGFQTFDFRQIGGGIIR